MRMDNRSVAKALGGEPNGRWGILAPGPGHSIRDRSLSVLLDWQAPDGFVVKSFAGDDPLACRDYVRERLGLAPWRPGRREKLDVGIPTSSKRPQESTDKTGTARALERFKEAAPLRGTIAERYLQRRIGGAIEWPPDLRFHKSCPRQVDDKFESHPAIIALLRDIRTNEPRAIQRIFLKPDGSDHLRDDKAKAMLGPAVGACVKLSLDSEVTTGLGIGEGIETCLAVLALGWRPIWAAVSTAGMSEFPVLGGIETLTVFADHDENGTGERAARKVAQRWADAGRGAKIVLPRTCGADWNDALGVAA